MKKPTGKPGGPNDRIHRCIAIEKRILAKTHWGMLGLSLEDEHDVPGGKEDDSLGEGSEGGGGVNESFDSALFDSAQNEDDDRNTDAAVVPALPPLPCPVGEGVQDTGENEGVMTAPSAQASSAQVDVRSALKRAESSVKAQKTKHASNKNKERTSIAGTIVKLFEKDNSSSDGVSANLSMMLMPQMEAINKSMEKREHRERIDKRRKRKCRKKRHTKKREKKRAKKAALEGQEDHGGKAGVVGSSDSSSSIDSSDSESNSDSDST
jgi:hypothetical protein